MLEKVSWKVTGCVRRGKVTTLLSAMVDCVTAKPPLQLNLTIICFTLLGWVLFSYVIVHLCELRFVS